MVRVLSVSEHPRHSLYNGSNVRPETKSIQFEWSYTLAPLFRGVQECGSSEFHGCPLPTPNRGLWYISGDEMLMIYTPSSGPMGITFTVHPYGADGLPTKGRAGYRLAPRHPHTSAPSPKGLGEAFAPVRRAVSRFVLLSKFGDCAGWLFMLVEWHTPYRI